MYICTYIGLFRTVDPAANHSDCSLSLLTAVGSKTLSPDLQF